MVIQSPKLVQDDKQAKLTARVICDQERRELWYSISAEYAAWFSTDRCDGFVVGLLFQSMQRNEGMVVEGPVSSRLFHNLREFFIPMMAQAFPNLHPIKITPASLI